MATSSKSSSGAGAKKAGPTVADDVQDAFIKPLKGMADRLQNLPLAGAAGAIVESGRKDLAALMEANEKSYQGLQAVVQRQTEMLKASIVEWQGAVKGMSPAEPRENLSKLDAMGKAAFKQALDDIRELSELAARSQAEAFDIVSQRIRSNVDEVSKLLKAPKK
ncbi:TIGR01841 family phasin [Variovorax sp. KK3]|uniref:TIGR01841 family phasin n=1 Tax=Variovorax sp. KK3 TaxID=1855728 RepID=UPI00097CB697|nr:TIGR01841 family phasin [Variovorax sp. KK3]